MEYEPTAWDQEEWKREVGEETEEGKVFANDAEEDLELLALSNAREIEKANH